MPKTVRNVFGIVALVISGFFFYAVAMMAFINQPAWPIKTVVVLVFVIPAVIFLLIGVWCHGFDKFERDLGIVLLAASANTLLVIFSFVSMLASPDVGKLLSPDSVQMFSAIWSGAFCLILYIVVGLALLLFLKRRQQTGLGIEQQQ